jgi:Fic family protein
MEELRNEIRAGLAALDANILLSPEQRLRYLVALAAHVFVAFLTIHPYANGNGHAARLIVWSVFGRYGHWPKNWPVEPRPTDPSYLQLIVLHRDAASESPGLYYQELQAGKGSLPVRA